MTPYFVLEFEALCQYHDLLPWASSDATAVDASVSLLAQRAIAQLRPSKATERVSPRLLTDLSSYVASDFRSPRHLAALKDDLMSSVLEKMYVPLHSHLPPDAIALTLF